ncbi:MAG: hypothetical protein ACHQYP_06385 [Nitrospiria bacterium]
MESRHSKSGVVTGLKLTECLFITIVGGLQKERKKMAGVNR